MKHQSYLVAGLSHTPTTPDKVDGWTEVFIYNPTHSTNEVQVTAYFADRPPFVFPERYHIPPQTSVLPVMPDVDEKLGAQIFGDAGFWGLKLESSHRLDPILIQVLHPFKTMPEEPAFKGGVSHFIGMQLHPQWHFADGLWLNWTAALNGEIEKAPFPFNELEYYFFLNPHEKDAQVEMTLQFRSRKKMVILIAIPAGRCISWCNYEIVPYNEAYGVKVTASLPVAAASARYIYSLKGFEDWGINFHCGMPAEPGPIVD